MALSSADMLTLVLSDSWDGDYNQEIQAKLRVYNRQTALNMEPPDARPLNVRVQGPDGELVGGLVALTYWGWMVIKLLVLDDGHRGNGVGQQLIRKAHDEARARGCTRVQTMTYDFQALQFYLKQGYRVVGCLKDYPDDYDYFWLRKDFEEIERSTDEGTDSTGSNDGDHAVRLRSDSTTGGE